MDKKEKELEKGQKTENEKKQKKLNPILLFIQTWKNRIGETVARFLRIIKAVFSGRAKLELADYFILGAIMLGSGLLIYPTIGDLYSRWKTMQSMEQYENIVDEMDMQEIEDEIERAREYNETLWGTYYKGIGPDEEDGSNLMKEGNEEYNDILNITRNGVIGYLVIDKINSYSTVYHGSTDSVLAVGVGHLFSTGFPVDGPNVHSALSAHTGLASATLFTDLDQLEIGDSFEIHILNKVYTYQIEQILIVDPDNLSELQIEYGSNFLTLITCYPYGVNSHRLLVRGRLQGYNYDRNDYEDYFEYEDVIQEEDFSDWEEEGEKLTQTGIEWAVIGKVAGVGSIITCMAFLCYVFFKRTKMTAKRQKVCFIFGMVGLVLLLADVCMVGTSLIEEYTSGKACKEQMQMLKAYFEHSDSAEDEEDIIGESESTEIVQQEESVLQENVQMHTITIGEHSYVGKMSIPQLNIEVPLMAECSDKNLKIAPCVEMGTIAGRNLVIAGHRYGEVFGNLAKLQVDDKIYITTTENKVYTYKVKSYSEILPRKKDLYYGYYDWDLAVYTCTTGGTNRYVVYAELME